MASPSVTDQGAAPSPELAPFLSDYQLPVFSGVVLTALDKVRDRSADAAEVANVLEADPGVTVKLLGLANSASYGLVAKVNSAAHAVALLGRGQVEALMLSIAVVGALPKSPLPELDGMRFWCAAARRATIAKALAMRTDGANEASASFSAALLQDMAVPLIAQVVGSDYVPLLSRWRSEGADLVQLEREAFGFDHASVGGWMAQQWNFTDTVVDAIAGHHAAAEGWEPSAVQAVSGLTDEIEDYGADGLVEVAVAHFGMSEDEARALIEHAETAAGELARLFV